MHSVLIKWNKKFQKKSLVKLKFNIFRQIYFSGMGPENELLKKYVLNNLGDLFTLFNNTHI